MRVHVLLLRREGVRLPEARDKHKWHHGLLYLSSGPKRLVLQDGRAAPGMGTIITLYSPVLTGINDHQGELTFRGIEQVDGPNGFAAMCQEWAVLFAQSFRFPDVKLVDYNFPKLHSTVGQSA
jgi:hypothetical protein